jgi:hypothetical protein
MCKRFPLTTQCRSVHAGYLRESALTTGGRDGRRRAVPRGLRVGGGHLRLPGGGGGRRGRAGALDLGHLRRDAGAGGRGGHRGGGGRPLPPLPAGRGPHGRPRAGRLPVLGGLATGPARGAGAGQPRGPRLLPAAGRPPAGVRDRALDHPVPLGPPPGAAGRRRLGRPRGGRPLRRLRQRRLRGPVGPGGQLDDPERAVVRGLPGPRGRRPRPGRPGPGHRGAGRPPPAGRPRPGDQGDAGPGRPAPARHQPQPGPGHPGLARPGRHRRRPPHRRRLQPAVPRPAVPRALPGRRARGPGRPGRAGPGARRRPGGDRGPARPTRRQLLPPLGGGRPAGAAAAGRAGVALGGRRGRRVRGQRPAPDRPRLGDRPVGPGRAAAAAAPRLPVAAAVRDRERGRVRGRPRRQRPGPGPGQDPVPGRAPAGRPPGDPGRGRPARLLRLVAAGQLRVGRGLLQAVRHRLRRLPDPAPAAQGQRPLVPGDDRPRRPGRRP